MKIKDKKLIIFLILCFPAIITGFVVNMYRMGFDFGKKIAVTILK